jgi:hypothetical protein
MIYLSFFLFTYYYYSKIPYTHIQLTADLAWWWEYSPTTQEVASSIPAHCKHLCA